MKELFFSAPFAACFRHFPCCLRMFWQAPAAIRALTSIFRPLMYPRPYLAPYLPILLELTLPGLDANDVFKTTVTLRLYHLILSWVPIQGSSVR